MKYKYSLLALLITQITSLVELLRVQSIGMPSICKVAYFHSNYKLVVGCTNGNIKTYDYNGSQFSQTNSFSDLTSVQTMAFSDVFNILTVGDSLYAQGLYSYDAPTNQYSFSTTASSVVGTGILYFGINSQYSVKAYIGYGTKVYPYV